jgi:porphobilinogen synthase
MQNAIRHQSRPEMIVMPDVALDPILYGHDGIIANGDVENDSTNDALVKWLFLMHKLVPIL